MLNRHEKARAEIASAEALVSQGIEYLYHIYKPHPDEYDAQGVATKFVSSSPLSESDEDVKNRENFPSKLRNGVVLHFFKEGFIQHPPVAYMIQQKVESLLNAAVLQEWIDSDKKQDLKDSLEMECKARLKMIVDESKGDVSAFHKKSNELMKYFVGKVASELAQFQDTPEMNEIFKEAKHHRSNSADILTFNEATQKFSYDESAKVAAHVRDMDSGAANLSLVFEGDYSDNHFKVTTSLVKHASLAPLDSISQLRLGSIHPKIYEAESDIHILMATVDNMAEVVRDMARLRQHGGAKSPIEIDWVYQLLTSNAFNSENQAASYAYIVKAASLLSNLPLKLADGTVVKAKASVMNAGINSLGAWDIQRKDMQRRENRKAFLQITEALHDLPLPNSDMLALMLPPVNEGLQNRYKELEDKLQRNAVEFMQARELYSGDDSRFVEKVVEKIIARSDSINNEMRKVSYEIEKIQKHYWKENREDVFSEIERWRSSILENKDIMKDHEILQNAALMYKAYMNDLYYSGDYRKPEKAAAFNAYMAAYQHLTGMMCSSGCKSANDRTYVVRQLLAALEGRNIKDFPLPEALHTKSSKQWGVNAALSANAMSNSAMFSCIDDTGGGTPKVSSSKFPYLSGIVNNKYIGKFGKYAAHKIKKIFGEIKAAYNKFIKKDKFEFESGAKQDLPVPNVQKVSLARSRYSSFSSTSFEDSDSLQRVDSPQERGNNILKK